MKNILSQIVLSNAKREKNTLSKYACRNREGKRKYETRERINDRINIRPIFFHDTDKIIHSLAYTRYIDKTQVFYLFENDHITHRVLHVQFVSKIARVIGRCLKLNEDLIEAIALGHDIGHTPFGHDGESFLNEICKNEGIGHFYHNAQSVKLLHEIENKGNGLNLSLQVLDGILAHNGEILSAKYIPVKEKKWDDFEKEYRKCFQKKDYYKKIVPMTLEACVVRISDIIAYIGRDFEDAIEVKLIKRNSLPKEISKIIGNSNDKIINTLVMDIINNSYDKNYIKLRKKR
jgi:dGTPase